MRYLADKPFLTSALQRSQKFHIIKLKTLLARLLILDSEKYFENSTQNILEFISKLKSQELIDNGSDFFWSIIHRLSNAIDKKDKAVIEKTYIYFLLNFFDSFYLLLPTDSKISFKGLEEKEVIFPKLKLSFGFYLDCNASLLKSSNTSLEYKFDSFENCEYKISLDNIPSWFQLRKEIACDRINVLYQEHPNIFEEHYSSDCCENVFLGHSLKNKIENAFEKIKSTDIDLYKKLVASIDFIIPYGNDVRKKYPNFAIATLKKTIFLSIELLTEHEIFIAECIIHEYSHCELHLVQDTILLTNIENNILEYYSPWRKDPRPLLGVIHAIYISHEIIGFYYSYLQNGNNNQDEIKLVKEKIEIVIHQIFVAQKQIRQNQLTDFTIELMNSILESTKEISENLSISISNPPEEIVKHKEVWKFKNQSLLIIE